MKKYECIKDCRVAGKTLRVGDVVELADDVAKGLIAMSRIVEAKAAPKKKADRSVGLKEDKVSTRKAKEPEVHEEEPKEAE